MPSKALIIRLLLLAWFLFLATVIGGSVLALYVFSALH